MNQLAWARPYRNSLISSPSMPLGQEYGCSTLRPLNLQEVKLHAQGQQE